MPFVLTIIGRELSSRFRLSWRNKTKNIFYPRNLILAYSEEITKTYKMDKGRERIEKEYIFS